MSLPPSDRSLQFAFFPYHKNVTEQCGTAVVYHWLDSKLNPRMDADLPPRDGILRVVFANNPPAVYDECVRFPVLTASPKCPYPGYAAEVCVFSINPSRRPPNLDHRTDSEEYEPQSGTDRNEPRARECRLGRLGKRCILASLTFNSSFPMNRALIPLN